MVFDISIDKIVREAHRATLTSSDAADYAQFLQDYLHFTQPEHISSFSLEAEQQFEEIFSLYNAQLPILAYTFGEQSSPHFYNRRLLFGLLSGANLLLGLIAAAGSLISPEHATPLSSYQLPIHIALTVGLGAAWLFYRSCTNNIEQNISSDVALFFSNASGIRPFFDNLRSELEKDLALYLQRII